MVKKIKIGEMVALSDFLDVDDNLTIARYPTEKDIFSSFMVRVTMSMKKKTYKSKKPSCSKMISYFDLIRRGLRIERNVHNAIFHPFQKCEKFYENVTNSESKQ